MDPVTQPQPSNSGPKGSAVDSQTIEQCITFLHQKDDTSRFVGLAMLSSLLTHVQDLSVLSKCWAALDSKFLDRLLKAGERKKQNGPEETKDMVDLAANVINAFSTLLPNAAENESFVARSKLLIKVLPQSAPITAATILQTLLAFSTGRKGSEAILSSPDLLSLVQASIEHENSLQVLQYSFVNSISSPELLQERLKSFLPSLCEYLSASENALRLRILGFLSELLTRMPSEYLPSDTTWVIQIYQCIQTTITSAHASKERHACIIIAASLLHKYPPTLLFRSKASAKAAASSKPFVYFFMQLVLIDIRASFPSLLEQIASPSYGTIAHRLASDFDIVGAFLGYLVMSEEIEKLEIDTDLLLKLQRDIGETFGLTIEFLRDRWDAAYAGAAGFEPGYEKDVPKSLAWESNLEGGLERDPLVMAAIRALSLWLREDDSLRKEAGGLTDLFLGLWTKGAEAGVDYRSWIIGALQGTVWEKNGQEMFKKSGGWDLVWGDLKRIYRSCNVSEEEEEVRLAIEEAGVLTEFVRGVEASEESWVKDVVKVANIKGSSGVRLELDAAVLRLASVCLANVHKAVRKKIGNEVVKMKQICERLTMDLGRQDGGEDALEMVVEAAEELDALGL
ncbi:hypothetical protein RUND412_003020 [Rhizina undulata]